MKTDFKVYSKKIHVYRESNMIDCNKSYKTSWVYVWSTNAHNTCKSAIASAKELHPNVEFKASFAKD